MLRLKLPAKFLLLVIGILAVFLGIFSAIIAQRETKLLARKNAEQEHMLAQSLVADLRDNMLAGRPRSTLSLIESLRGTHGLVRLDVFRSDGTPAFGSRSERIDLPQLREAFRTGRVVDFNEDGGTPLHTNIFPLRNDAECRTCHRASGDILGVILISHSLEEMQSEVRKNQRQVVILFSLMVLVIGTALYTAVHLIIHRPLQALSEGARVVGRGELSHRITIESRDELRDLADAFNDMAGRLKESYAGLENMVRIRTAELNESVRLMRGILASMSSGVVLLAGDGTVKMINRQGAWILGQGHEDLVGKKLTDAAPETAAFQNARVGTYEEITISGPEGMTIPVGFTSSHYAGGEGEQEGLIVVFQDLTELKALQAELLNKERFAAMGRVVAGVAHEIRNPLFGISAIGQIFERDLKEPDQQELSRALIAETKRLNQLVEELLIYGRPMKLKLEEADLRLLWEDVLDLHREELKRKNISVRGDYAVRHPVTLFDPYQIKQVFLNLLRNAMEATPEGGTITITMLLEDNSILFRVADTGSGIPRAHLEHVFDLFFTTKPKGTGLGLAICRKILQDHGGDITISSEEGAGTAVTIRLPLHIGSGSAVSAVS
ncbi:MAG: ATP-binding protein [Nitrospiraceae bacterium]|nr:ATP-binding protein [Nitrospiraceae bacterium]